MKHQALLLVLVGAFFLAGAAAGPIRPVAKAIPDSQSASPYVVVRLLFEGELAGHVLHFSDERLSCSSTHSKPEARNEPWT